MKLPFLGLLSFFVAALSVAEAADWPQWRGPDRNGVSRETGLLRSWPKGGPPLLWTYNNTGVGFSTPAIVGDRLYTAGVRGEHTHVIALDVNGPKEIWSTKIAPVFTFKSNTWGDGPRGTPTVDGDYLYVLDGQGELVCLQTADGKLVWRKNLIKDLGGEMMTEWGYSESPLVDGDLLICTPGGPTGTMAALNKKTGEVVWRSSALTNKAPYTSAVVSNAGGAKQYVQTSYIDDTRGGVVSGFSAKDGKVLWSQPIFKGQIYLIASTPIVRDNLVYATTYNAITGCHLFEIKGSKTRELYSKSNQKSMKNNHGGVVLVGDHVYGMSDARSGWVCQEFKTGKSAWHEPDKLECKSGSIISADGYLYLFSDEGTAVLLEANPKAWTEKGRFSLPQKAKSRETRGTSKQALTWTHPVIANGRLYLRDQELLFCYDVRAGK
jgi:outer membrane protein assembly factor BamB